jgi:hypothetical protein
MIGNLLFIAIIWAVAAFMVNRLYVIVRYRAINVKGVTYSKVKTPVMFWIVMALIIIANILVGGIAVVTTIYSVSLVL